MLTEMGAGGASGGVSTLAVERVACDISYAYIRFSAGTGYAGGGNPSGNSGGWNFTEACDSSASYQSAMNTQKFSTKKNPHQPHRSWLTQFIRPTIGGLYLLPNEFSISILGPSSQKRTFQHCKALTVDSNNG